MQNLCQKYIDNVQKYNRLESITFSKIDSDSEILQTLSAITGKKRIIRQEQDRIIQELLSPYESKEQELNEESFLNLQSFAKLLFENYKEVDNALSLRIHNLLLEYAKAQGDYDKIVEEIYWCGICQWRIYKYDINYFTNPYYEQITNYRKQFDILSDVAKSFYLRSMANRILTYTNKRPGSLLQMGKEILAEISIFEKEYPDINFNYNAAKLSTYRNMTTGLRGFRNNEDLTDENVQLLLDAAEQSMKMIGKKDSTSAPFESSYYYTLYAAQFHAGKIDLGTFLNYLDPMTVPEKQYSKRENCNRVFFNTACYIEYLNLYSDKSSKEIATLVKEKVDKVINYAATLERDEETGFIDSYLQSFLEASFDALPYELTKNILCQISINRHKETYIHTQVVKRICEELVRYIIKNNPEYLEGICDNYSADYISEHKEEILSIMEDMAQLHDLGKCTCIKIISNASRKLEDCEFDIIKRHPDAGCNIIQRTSLLKPVEDGMKYHHVWHNGKGGYPQGEPLTNNQPLIDILTIADCLDAATDIFGRSYANPKSVETVIEEFEQSRDERYAGFVIDALKQPKVLEAVQKIIDYDRRAIICAAYRQKQVSIQESGLLTNEVLERNIILENKVKSMENRIRQLEIEDQRKNRFIAQISHEVRTPLNVVIGMASIAKDEIDNTDQVREYLTDIENSSRLLIGVVNDILDISGLASGYLKVERNMFDLKEQITNLSILFYEQARQKDIHFDIHIKGVSEEFIIGDERRVTQILMNLLNSSVKFTPAGGKIDLTVMQASESRDRVHMRFIVKDTGAALPSDVMESIISPVDVQKFLQNKFSSETALGISIAKQLVELLDGSISSNSVQGDGSEIIVDIPFEKTAQNNLQELSGMANIRTLIVADNDAICRERGEMLADMGLDYDVAVDFESAMDVIAQAEEERRSYKLCMIDWNLKNESAEFLISEIRDLFGKDMIIIATAYDSKHEMDKGIAAGANYVIENTLFRSTIFDALVKLEKGEVVKQENLKGIAEEYDFTGKKILVVEDVPLNMEVVVKVLSKVNATIVCAENGQEAVATYYRKPEGFFDCIFMDVNMPIMDGYTATEKIRSSNRSDAKTVPIYAMTANAFTSDIAQALDAGMDGHIAKPIDVRVLYSTLQNMFYGTGDAKLQESLKERTQQLKEQNEELRKKVELDPLTNLLNRFGFEKRILQMMSEHQEIGFMIIDIDHFKTVNDNYGHEVGDRVLVRAAESIVHKFRSTDYVVRFGGDEFVVILNNGENMKENAVNKIKEVNEELMRPMDGIPAVSVSVGVAFSKDGYYKELYDQADIALYQTKRNGRCGCTIYKGDLG